MRPITGEDIDATRVMIPVKPMLFRVMVDVAEPPVTRLEGVAAPAVMVKSGLTVTVTAVE